MSISLLWGTLLVQGTCAYRISSSASASGAARAPFWEDPEMFIKTWTWNSGKADLTEEAHRLGRSSVDVLVTCQTEATRGIHHFMSEEWILLAHGEHWGAAGGGINAQMSSVFVRKPLDGSSIFHNTSEIIGRKPWRSDVASQATFRVHGAELLALAQVTATDYKGKGGVTTTLTFPKTSERDQYKVQFVCAHLDSESDEACHFGIAQMLSEARAPDVSSATALRRLAVGKSGEIRKPCTLYDSMFMSCSTKKLPEGIGDAADAVLLFGDLNFRLSSFGIENVSQALFMDDEGRMSFAWNDRLSGLNPRIFGYEGQHKAKQKDVLVKPVKEGGFGFQCNEPFAMYPPTYKRKGGQVQLERVVHFSENWQRELQDAKDDLAELGMEVLNSTGHPLPTLVSPPFLGGVSPLGIGAHVSEEDFPLHVKSFPHEACSKMGEAMQTCGGQLQPICKTWVYEMAAKCYVRKDKKSGQIKWSQKKDDLQLGWLDRFCWRTTLLNTKLGVRLHQEEGWSDVPGAQDKIGGSDHMPVAATFRFSTVKCSCFKDLGDSNAFIPACRMDGQEDASIRYKEILSGDFVTARCRKDHQMSNGQRETAMVCGKDGKLRSVSGGEVKCLQECKFAHLPLFREFNGVDNFLAGQTIDLSCKDPSHQMLGVPSVFCSHFGGTFFVNPKRPATCVARCDIGLQGNVVLTQRRLADEKLLQLYASEIKSMPLHGKLLQGGEVRYKCRANCLSVGTTIRTCQDYGHLWPRDPVKCGCSIRLSVKAVTFTDSELGSLIDKVKLQLYRGPVTEEQLEYKRSHKGYEKATKFNWEDVENAVETPTLEADNPANLELHLTLCAKNPKSQRSWAFWRCAIVAQTAVGSFNLQELLQGKDNFDGRHMVDLPLVVKDRGVIDQKYTRVKLQLEYHISK